MNEELIQFLWDNFGDRFENVSDVETFRGVISNPDGRKFIYENLNESMEGFDDYNHFDAAIQGVPPKDKLEFITELKKSRFQGIEDARDKADISEKNLLADVPKTEPLRDPRISGVGRAPVMDAPRTQEDKEEILKGIDNARDFANRASIAENYSVLRKEDVYSQYDGEDLYIQYENAKRDVQLNHQYLGEAVEMEGRRLSKKYGVSDILQEFEHLGNTLESGTQEDKEFAYHRFLDLADDPEVENYLKLIEKFRGQDEVYKQEWAREVGLEKAREAAQKKVDKDPPNWWQRRGREVSDAFGRRLPSSVHDIFDSIGDYLELRTGFRPAGFGTITPRYIKDKALRSALLFGEEIEEDRRWTGIELENLNPSNYIGTSLEREVDLVGGKHVAIVDSKNRIQKIRNKETGNIVKPEDLSSQERNNLRDIDLNPENYESRWNFSPSRFLTNTERVLYDMASMVGGSALGGAGGMTVGAFGMMYGDIYKEARRQFDSTEKAMAYALGKTFLLSQIERIASVESMAGRSIRKAIDSASPEALLDFIQAPTKGKLNAILYGGGSEVLKEGFIEEPVSEAADKIMDQMFLGIPATASIEEAVDIVGMGLFASMPLVTMSGAIEYRTYKRNVRNGLLQSAKNIEELKKGLEQLQNAGEITSKDAAAKLAAAEELAGKLDEANKMGMAKDKFNAYATVEANRLLDRLFYGEAVSEKGIEKQDEREAKYDGKVKEIFKKHEEDTKIGEEDWNSLTEILEGKKKKPQSNVSDEVWDGFVDNGIVDDSVLENIADKVVDQAELSERERAIYQDNLGEINELLAKKKQEAEQPIAEEESVQISRQADNIFDLYETDADVSGTKSMIIEDSEGNQGEVRIDEGGKVEVEFDGEIREAGNIEDVFDQTLDELSGREGVKSVDPVSAEGNYKYTIGGKTYINTYTDPSGAINYDEDGNVVSVDLDSPVIKGEYGKGGSRKGIKRKTFKGVQAEELAYQILLEQKINNDNKQEAFQDFIQSEYEANQRQERESVVSESTKESADQVDEQVSEDFADREIKIGRETFDYNPETGLHHKVKRDGTLYKEPVRNTKQQQIEKLLKQQDEKTEADSESERTDTHSTDDSGLPSDSETAEKGKEATEKQVKKQKVGKKVGGELEKSNSRRKAIPRKGEQIRIDGEKFEVTQTSRKDGTLVAKSLVSGEELHLGQVKQDGKSFEAEVMEAPKQPKPEVKVEQTIEKPKPVKSKKKPAAKVKKAGIPAEKKKPVKPKKEVKLPEQEVIAKIDKDAPQEIQVEEKTKITPPKSKVRRMRRKKDKTPVTPLTMTQRTPEVSEGARKSEIGKQITKTLKSAKVNKKTKPQVGDIVMYDGEAYRVRKKDSRGKMELVNVNPFEMVFVKDVTSNEAEYQGIIENSSNLRFQKSHKSKSDSIDPIRNPKKADEDLENSHKAQTLRQSVKSFEKFKQALINSAKNYRSDLGLDQNFNAFANSIKEKLDGKVTDALLRAAWRRAGGKLQPMENDAVRHRGRIYVYNPDGKRWVNQKTGRSYKGSPSTLTDIFNSQNFAEIAPQSEAAYKRAMQEIFGLMPSVAKLEAGLYQIMAESLVDRGVARNIKEAYQMGVALISGNPEIDGENIRNQFIPSNSDGDALFKATLNKLNKERYQDLLKRETDPALREYYKEKLKLADKGLLYQDNAGAFDMSSRIMHSLFNPDASTPLHELIHAYEKFLSPEEMLVVQNWIKELTGKSPDLNTEKGLETLSEYFARGGEAYIHGGEALKRFKITGKVATVFRGLADWLRSIYNKLIGDEKVSAESLSEPMKLIYDKVFGLKDRFEKRDEAISRIPPRKAGEPASSKISPKNKATKEILDHIGMSMTVNLDRVTFEQTVEEAINLGWLTSVESGHEVEVSLAYMFLDGSFKPALHEIRALQAALAYALSSKGSSIQIAKHNEKLSTGNDKAVHARKVNEYMNEHFVLAEALRQIGTESMRIGGLRNGAIALSEITQEGIENLASSQKGGLPLNPTEKRIAKKLYTEYQASKKKFDDAAKAHKGNSERILLEEAEKGLKEVKSKARKISRNFSSPQLKEFLRKVLRGNPNVRFQRKNSASKKFSANRLNNIYKGTALKISRKDENFSTINDIVNYWENETKDSKDPITRQEVLTALSLHSKEIKKKAEEQLSAEIDKSKRELNLFKAFDRMLDRQFKRPKKSGEAITDGAALRASELLAQMKGLLSSYSKTDDAYIEFKTILNEMEDFMRVKVYDEETGELRHLNKNEMEDLMDLQRQLYETTAFQAIERKNQFLDGVRKKINEGDLSAYNDFYPDIAARRLSNRLKSAKDELSAKRSNIKYELERAKWRRESWAGKAAYRFAGKDWLGRGGERLGHFTFALRKEGGASLFRAFKTMMDVSMIFTHGMLYNMYALGKGRIAWDVEFRKRWWKTQGTLLRQIGLLIGAFIRRFRKDGASITAQSRDLALEIYQEMQNDPIYQIAKSGGLELTKPGGRTKSEEDFQSEAIQYIPGFRNIQNISEDVFTIYINMARLHMFKMLYNNTTAPSENQIKRLSAFSNIMTGRIGGKAGEFFSGGFASFVLLAPRYAAARFLTPFILMYRTLVTGIGASIGYARERITGRESNVDQAKKEIAYMSAKILASYVPIAAAMVGFGATELNPCESDFMRLKLKGSTKSFDFTAGSLLALRLLCRGGEYFDKNIIDTDLIDPPASRNKARVQPMKQEILRAFGYKLNPLWDAGTGAFSLFSEDFLNKPRSRSLTRAGLKGFGSLFAPIFVEQIVESWFAPENVMREESGLQKPMKWGALIGVTAAGLNVTDYTNMLYEQTVRDNLNNKDLNPEKFWPTVSAKDYEFLTPVEDTQIKLTHRAYREDYRREIENMYGALIYEMGSELDGDFLKYMWKDLLGKTFRKKERKFSNPQFRQIGQEIRDRLLGEAMEAGHTTPSPLRKDPYSSE